PANHSRLQTFPRWAWLSYSEFASESGNAIGLVNSWVSCTDGARVGSLWRASFLTQPAKMNEPTSEKRVGTGNIDL
ncbi:MAG: hypothetical protein AB8G99_14970, partial [Planctomycetaceae bacterium]